MRKVFAVSMLVLAVTLTLVAPAFGAPNVPDNASCVAHCAANMGGQHVAHCAQMMEKGVSECAKMSHADCMAMM